MSAMTVMMKIAKVVMIIQMKMTNQNKRKRQERRAVMLLELQVPQDNKIASNNDDY